MSSGPEYPVRSRTSGQSPVLRTRTQYRTSRSLGPDTRFRCESKVTTPVEGSYSSRGRGSDTDSYPTPTYVASWQRRRRPVPGGGRPTPFFVFPTQQTAQPGYTVSQTISSHSPSVLAQSVFVFPLMVGRGMIYTHGPVRSHAYRRTEIGAVGAVRSGRSAEG